MPSEKFPKKIAIDQQLIVAYFKLHNVNQSGSGDSRSVAPLGRPPELEICLIPEDQAITCMHEGLFKVPAGAITIRLMPGDPFPDVRNLGQFQWAANEYEKETRQDVTPKQKALPSATKELPQPEDTKYWEAD